MTEIKDMTREEVNAELARVRAERALLNGNGDAPAAPVPDLAVVAAEAVNSTPETNGEDPAPAKTGEPEPWPHATMEFRGEVLEIRRPKESALLAVSVAGVGGLPPMVQIQVFSAFLKGHLSPKSMQWALVAMMDPETDVDINSLVTALTEHADLSQPS